MKKTDRNVNDEMRPEYDFASMRGGVRGKHVRRLYEECPIVRLKGAIENDRAILDFMSFKEAVEKVKKQGHKTFIMTGDKGFLVLVDDTYSYTAEQLTFLVQNGLKPGAQIWSRVVLNGDVPDMQATALMNAVVKAYQETNLPKGVEVYRAPAAGGFVYYFSPGAAALIPSAVPTMPCVKPDVSNMKKQTF